MQFVALFTFLSSIVGPLVAKVLTALGVGLVTYTGITLVMDQARDAIVSNMSATGAAYVAIFGLAKVDVAVNIMLGAVAARAALSGIDKASGSVTKIGSVGKGG
ncbi:DUF2523 domain-containing protein [Pseudomonas nitroreducens]|uniref:DUF2523 domain-containing protein n=1 Tax=Pseudomonas nitroreducens TaxID=46680 RepID=UPI00147573E5|nr:DUF2523 domain-containing protein [Pseudomonas nitroreducens]NMZ77623.1 DUF2523 domain-containing protein [Pseudomonas nitroreducens]NMZ77640.1 DUF2523 domain-containing protein [Pseudomonas nitroreducens]